MSPKYRTPPTSPSEGDSATSTLAPGFSAKRPGCWPASRSSRVAFWWAKESREAGIDTDQELPQLEKLFAALVADSQFWVRCGVSHLDNSSVVVRHCCGPLALRHDLRRGSGSAKYSLASREATGFAQAGSLHLFTHPAGNIWWISHNESCASFRIAAATCARPAGWCCSVTWPCIFPVMHWDWCRWTPRRKCCGSPCASGTACPHGAPACRGGRSCLAGAAGRLRERRTFRMPPVQDTHHPGTGDADRLDRAFPSSPAMRTTGSAFPRNTRESRRDSGPAAHRAWRSGCWRPAGSTDAWGFGSHSATASRPSASSSRCSVRRCSCRCWPRWDSSTWAGNCPPRRPGVSSRRLTETPRRKPAWTSLAVTRTGPTLHCCC